MKKILSFICSATILTMLCMLSVFATSEDYVAIYAQVPEDWTAPCVWAWADDGTNAFDAWPGGEMDADTNNPGWYYCHIPSTTNNLIINANEGAVQTAVEIKLDGGNNWISITSPEDVAISTEQLTTGDIPEYIEKYEIHAKVPADWETVNIWAWSDPDGRGAFTTWPGKEMKLEDTGWYSAMVPVYVNSIIINTNGGEVKTEDIKGLDAAELWVAVADDGTYDFSYNDPDKAAIPDVTIHVSAPADWTAPNLWAWSAPDGTNVYTSWPGEALDVGDDGWMTKVIPGWVNSIIVNAQEGGIQTTDVSIETEKDVWLVVADGENFEVFYEEPDIAAMAPVEPEPPATEPEPQPEPADPEPVVTKPADPAPTETAPATDTEHSAPAQENNATPIIIAVVVVAALVGGGLYAVKKKKN